MTEKHHATKKPSGHCLRVSIFGTAFPQGGSDSAADDNVAVHNNLNGHNLRVHESYVPLN